MDTLDRSFGKAIENVGKNLNQSNSESDQINLIKMLLSQYELEKETERKKEQEREEIKNKKWSRKALKFIMNLISFIMIAKNKFLLIVKNVDNLLKILIVIQIAVFLNGVKNLWELNMSASDVFDWLAFNRNAGAIIIVIYYFLLKKTINMLKLFCFCFLICFSKISKFEF